MGRVVLAGGAGFIGQAVTAQLLNQRHYDRILVIGRSATPKYDLPSKAVDYLQGDVTSGEFLSGLLTPEDCVIDLCHSSVPKTSFDNPLDEVAKNIPASVNLMHHCATVGVRKYLLVSSGGTVYGNVSVGTIDEHVATNPISPYGISKLVAEKFALFYHQNFGLKAVIVRPSNPYGKEQVGARIQGFIGVAIFNLMTSAPVTVFGEAGTVRDYIFNEDLASGIVDCLIHGSPAEVYNIGTGIGLSNLDVLEALETVFQKRFVKINREAARPFDVNRNVLDASKLRALAGWQPKVDIYAGLERLREGLK
jgi:UDP-glucose 4-epimerase